MPRLTYIWLIALKDLKRFSRDRFAVLFFMAFPLMFITLFSLMNVGGGATDPRLEFHLATQEGPGTISYQIISSMETENVSNLASGQPYIVWEKDYDAAFAKVENDELSGFLAFPADFTEKIYAGEKTSLEVIVNPANTTTRAALFGLADSISTSIGADYVIVGSTIELMLTKGLITPAEMESIQQVLQMALMALNSEENHSNGINTVINKTGEIQEENSVNWTLTGYLVMFVFFGAALSAETIVKERQNHTLERMLTGTVRRSEILGGIFTGTAVKGIIQVLVFWLFGIFVFKADLGLSPLAVIVLSFIVVLMSSAFAVMLATLVKTQKSAGSAGTLTSLILAPLGGCWWPLFILPQWMQALGKITPHGWANTAFNKLMLFGADFGDVIPEMLVLLVFAIGFGLIAVWKFRTDAE